MQNQTTNIRSQKSKWLQRQIYLINRQMCYFYTKICMSTIPGPLRSPIFCWEARFFHLGLEKGAKEEIGVFSIYCWGQRFSINWKMIGDLKINLIHFHWKQWNTISSLCPNWSFAYWWVRVLINQNCLKTVFLAINILEIIKLIIIVNTGAWY